MFTPPNGGDSHHLDDIKIIKCKMCGKDVPCNVNYPVEQITCTVCYIGLKLKRIEKERGANLDEHSY